MRRKPGTDAELATLLSERPDLLAVADALAASTGTHSMRPECSRHRHRGWATKRTAVATAVALILATGLAVVPAFGLDQRVVNLFAFDRNSRVDAVPGQRIEPSAIEKRAADAARIDVSSLRRVVTAGEGVHRVGLLIGRNLAGQLVVTEEGFNRVGRFVPVAKRISHRRALVTYMAYGGRGRISWVSLVGFARSNVRRVVAVLASGRKVQLALNQAGGFGYSGSAPELVPRTVNAYTSTGRILESARVSVAPLCSAAEQCPAVVLPPARTADGFVRLVVIGSGGSGRVIESDPAVINSFFVRSSPLNADTPPAAEPQGGYVLLYLLDSDGVPGVPGRYYPESGAACFSWDQAGAPSQPCIAANPTLEGLLSGAADLPLYETEPTTLTSLAYNGANDVPQLLRTAFEMALNDGGESYETPSPDTCKSFEANWRGPDASQRPHALCLSREGVWGEGRMYPLGQGIWDRFLAP